MDSRRCPYCNQPYDSHFARSFHSGPIKFDEFREETLYIIQELCPSCGQISVTLMAHGYPEHFYYRFPPTTAMPLPEYIPAPIRQDYLEAIQIASLSPKAAATLARRCLQGIIHDFWGIAEKNLNAEISALKGKINETQWEAIDALRKIGNIGAHMEQNPSLIVDVEPEEAEKLLKLLELLFQDWYIRRHENEQLYNDIQEISKKKESSRRNDVNAD